MLSLFKKSIVITLFIAWMGISMFPQLSNAQTVSYTVQPGDTLWGIAVANKVELREIIALNSHLANPNAIYPHQQIRMPAVKFNVPAVEAEQSWEAKVL